MDHWFIGSRRRTASAQRTRCGRRCASKPAGGASRRFFWQSVSTCKFSRMVNFSITTAVLIYNWYYTLDVTAVRHKYKYFYFLHRGAMVPVSPPSLLSTSVCARMVPQTSMQKASTDRAKPRYRRFGKLAESLVPTQRGPCARSTARGERAACSSVAPPSVMFAKRTREDGGRGNMHLIKKTCKNTKKTPLLAAPQRVCAVR